MRRVASLVVAVSLMAPAPTLAAPGEHGALQDASTRYAEAQRRLDAGQHDEAVALLEDGLDHVPDGPGYAPTRARMLLLIVEANEAGFVGDGDLERLRRARRLLDRYLGPLDLLDEQGRGEAEERRSRLIEQIAQIEAARRRADGERAATERRERAEQARRQARRLTIAGTVTTSLGLAALAVMGAGLGVGRSADARIDALVDHFAGDGPCEVESAACEDRYQALQDERRRGNGGNVMFIAGAAAGGALLVTGVTLLVVARKQGRDARALQVTPTPTVSRTGVGLALIGRF